MIEIAGGITGGLLIGLALVALIYRDRVSLAILQRRMDQSAEPNGPNGEADAALARPTLERSESIDDYRLVLARVGVVLTAMGLLAIGYMVFRLAGIASHPGLFKSIFALGTFLVIIIASILLFPVLFLVRGSLRAARVIAWFAAIMSVSGAGA